MIGLFNIFEVHIFKEDLYYINKILKCIKNLTYHLLNHCPKNNGEGVQMIV